jgi:hypothetical protein
VQIYGEIQEGCEKKKADDCRYRRNCNKRDTSVPLSERYCKELEYNDGDENIFLTSEEKVQKPTSPRGFGRQLSLIPHNYV